MDKPDLSNGLNLVEEHTRHRILKLSIDILSFVSIGFLIIIAPIWGHYEQNTYGSDGQMSSLVKLILITGAFSVFGAPWCLLRYMGILIKKHPLVFDPRFRLLFVMSGPLLYLVGYLILKHTLWRIV